MYRGDLYIIGLGTGSWGISPISFMSFAEFGMTMQELRNALHEKGIETRTFFIPMHQQPIYKKKDPRFPDTKGNYPVANELSKKGLYLPSSSTLKKYQIRHIAKTIKEIRESR